MCSRAEHGEMIELLTVDDDRGTKIPADLIDKYSYRTRRIMKQRELMLQYSKVSNLVIVTLPVAPQIVVASPLYHIWLELLSRKMPPTLFVRGNQQSVLTFYS